MAYKKNKTYRKWDKKQFNAHIGELGYTLTPALSKLKKVYRKKLKK